MNRIGKFFVHFHQLFLRLYRAGSQVMVDKRILIDGGMIILQQPTSNFSSALQNPSRWCVRINDSQGSSIFRAGLKQLISYCSN